jgi:hypothetical protein
MLPLTVATEDELSEAVAQRLLLDFPSLEVGLWLRRGGNGYLRSRIRKFCEMARHSPVLVITDLDTNTCPAALCRTWLGNLSHPPGLLLRVAVREIEAWLLADHDAMVALIGKHANGRLPDNPDYLHDPMDRILELEKRAPRAVRLDLRAEAGALARQGLGYNHRLCALVRSSWRPERAAERSPSLRRTIKRISELAVSITP